MKNDPILQANEAKMKIPKLHLKSHEILDPVRAWSEEKMRLEAMQWWMRRGDRAPSLFLNICLNLLDLNFEN